MSALLFNELADTIQTDNPAQKPNFPGPYLDLTQNECYAEKANIVQSTYIGAAGDLNIY